MYARPAVYKKKKKKKKMKRSTFQSPCKLRLSVYDGGSKKEEEEKKLQLSGGGGPFRTSSHRCAAQHFTPSYCLAFLFFSFLKAAANVHT